MPLVRRKRDKDILSDKEYEEVKQEALKWMEKNPGKGITLSDLERNDVDNLLRRDNET